MRVQSKPPRKAAPAPEPKKKGPQPKPVTLAKAKGPSVEDDFNSAKVPTEQELSAISKELQIAVQLQTTIDGMEEVLAIKRQELHSITTRKLPDIMLAAGTLAFKTPEGAKVEIKEFMSGSLPKEKLERDVALKFLEMNGAGPLIKNSFFIALGKGQKEELKQLTKALKGVGVDYTRKEDVNAQSLYAWARERVKNGEPLPLETLGLYSGRVAKITIPEAAAKPKG